jgi:hypothetical protein
VSGFGVKTDLEAGEWTPISLTAWNTSKLPRVAKSSLAAEIQEACIAEDESFLLRFIWAEMNGVTGTPDECVVAVPAILVTDAKALYDAYKSETSALGLKERRSGIELACLKQNMHRNMTSLRWVNSGAMLADAMTKGRMRYLMEEFLRNPSWKLVEDERFESFKKRQKGGRNAFDPQRETDKTQPPESDDEMSEA